jgi:hypothetical protein
LLALPATSLERGDLTLSGVRPRTVGFSKSRSTRLTWVQSQSISSVIRLCRTRCRIWCSTHRLTPNCSAQARAVFWLFQIARTSPGVRLRGRPSFGFCRYVRSAALGGSVGGLRSVRCLRREAERDAAVRAGFGLQPPSRRAVGAEGHGRRALDGFDRVRPRSAVRTRTGLAPDQQRARAQRVDPSGWDRSDQPEKEILLALHALGIPKQFAEVSGMLAVNRTDNGRSVCGWSGRPLGHRALLPLRALGVCDGDMPRV